MGVHGLWDLLAPSARKIKIQALEDKTLAIDISIWMIQMLQGYISYGKEDFQNAHLVGILRRIVKMLIYGIKPVFVFDGKCPDLKKQTIRIRNDQRERKNRNLKKLAERAVAKVLEQRIYETAKKSGTIANKPPSKKQSQTQDVELDTSMNDMDDDELFDYEFDIIVNENKELLEQNGVDLDEFHLMEPNKQYETVKKIRNRMVERKLEKFQKIGNLEELSREHVKDYVRYVKREVKKEHQRQEKLKQRLSTEEEHIKENPKFKDIVSTEYIKGFFINPHREVIGSRMAADSTKSFLYISKKRADDYDEILQLTKVKRVSKREKMRMLQLQMRDIAKTTEDFSKNYRPEDLFDENPVNLFKREAKKIDNEHKMFQEQQTNKKTRAAQNNEITVEEFDDLCRQMGIDYDENEQPAAETTGDKDKDSPTLHGTSLNDKNETVIPDQTRPEEDVKENSNGDDKGMEEEDLSKLFGDDDFEGANEENVDKVDDYFEEAEDLSEEVKQKLLRLTQEIEAKNKQAETATKIVPEEQLSHEQAKNRGDSALEVSDDEQTQKMKNLTGIVRRVPDGESDDSDREDQRKEDEKETRMIAESEEKSSSKAIPQASSNEEHRLKAANADEWTYKPKVDKPTKVKVASPEKQKSSFVESDNNVHGDSVSNEKSVSRKSLKLSDSNPQESNETKVMEDEKPLDWNKKSNLSIETNIIPSLFDYCTGASSEVQEEMEISFEKCSVEKKAPELQDDKLEDLHQQQLSEYLHQINEAEEEEEIQEISFKKPQKKVNRIEDDDDEGLIEIDTEKKMIDEEEYNDFNIDDYNYGDEVENFNKWSLMDEFNRYSALQEMGGGNLQDKFEDVRNLLRLLGIPWVESPAEAEAQCCVLEQLGLVDGVVTEDSDVFLFGAKNVYKRIFEKGDNVHYFNSNRIIEEMGLTNDKLIYLALFLGSDYTVGVRGVGIVNAMEIVTVFDNVDALKRFKEWAKAPDVLLDDALEHYENAPQKELEYKVDHRNWKKHWDIPDEFPDPRVIKAYKTPEADRSDEPFTWGTPDIDKLRELCEVRFRWDKSRIDELLLPLQKTLENKKQQKKMTDYFKKEEKVAVINSKRLNKAIEVMQGKEKSTPEKLKQEEKITKSLSHLINQKLKRKAPVFEDKISEYTYQKKRTKRTPGTGN